MKLLSFKLSAENAVTLNKKHPWIFRGKVSSYARKFKDGTILKLLDPAGKMAGIGIYSDTGLIAIRVIFFGDNFELKYFSELILEIINRKKILLKNTNSIRWIHGENDILPGITIDEHADAIIIMLYSASLYSFGRFIGNLLYRKLTSSEFIKLKPSILLLKSPIRKGHDQGNTPGKIRFLRGLPKTEKIIQFRKIQYKIDITGQKSGIYNDIRNLRNFVLDHPENFSGKKVLNLFSNNGLLSVCLEKAGADKIYSIDESKHALEIHKKNIESAPEKHILVKLNIFKDLENYLKELKEKFDIIIIDPPSLTASAKDIKNAKESYKRLIVQTAKYLTKPGMLILCSCSNRIHSNEFERISQEAMEMSGLKHRKPVKLKPEIDHPVISTFPEGDYFKVHIYAVGE
ncbi:MAG: class I SAM-dependent methyltransferase [Leptospira sp.]|nr:class I SAM-dependent methyltransferase [Leptospira sp.]